MAEKLIALITRDVGRSRGSWYSLWKTTYLIETDKPNCIGKRFFLQMANGASRTWLSDEKVAETLVRWGKEEGAFYAESTLSGRTGCLGSRKRGCRCERCPIGCRL